MNPTPDYQTLLLRRLRHHSHGERSVALEMEELSAAYNRYVDLEGQLKEHRKRKSYITRLLGPERVAKATNLDSAEFAAKGSEATPPQRAPQERLPLWRAVRECLRVAGKSRLSDIEAFLNSLGSKRITRQAVDSALKRHADWFKVTKERHTVYVDLKD
jgi:hypothetical protein